MKVGDKVVCINDSATQSTLGVTYPKEGQIYTIRLIRKGYTGELAILLQEIVNAPRMYRQGFHEIAFFMHRFRPIDYTYGTEVCEAIETEFTKLKEPMSV